MSANLLERIIHKTVGHAIEKKDGETRRWGDRGIKEFWNTEYRTLSVTSFFILAFAFPKYFGR